MARFPDPPRFEDQPWYPEWKKSMDRVVKARLAVDASLPDTPERLAADQELNDALDAHRRLVNRLR